MIMPWPLWELLLTRDQIKLVSRYAPEIYVSYDGDKAGISATHRATELCAG